MLSCSRCWAADRLSTNPQVRLLGNPDAPWLAFLSLLVFTGGGQQLHPRFAVRLLNDLFGLRVDVITGPATDNEVGRDYVRGALGLPAFNAFKDPRGLVGAVRRALEARAVVTPAARAAS